MITTTPEVELLPLPADDAPFRSILWLERGLLVGGALGTAAGTIVPIIGNAVGAIVGVAAGMVIGTLVAMFSAVTRLWFPSSAFTVERRERLFCIAVIWALAIWFNLWADVPWGTIPALLGTIHAAFAGSPEPDAIYAGRPSKRAAMVCHWLPWAVVALCVIGWVAVGVADLT
jgi:hypothetical protein